MRRIQACVLRVDRHEHLHDVIFGQTVENDGWHGEIVPRHVVDVGVQRKQPVLAVNCAQDPLALRNLEPPDDGARLDRLETELLVARDDDRPGDGRQVARLATLLVILHEFVNFSPDDLALIGLLARGNSPLEEIPVNLRRRLSASTANGRLAGLAVVEHFEPYQLVDVLGGQRSLIELHTKLLHSDGSHVYHVRSSPAPFNGRR